MQPASMDVGPDATSSSTARKALVAYHLRVGWWSLLVFLSGGLVLDALHAFKVGLYLDVGMESRRLMWTLAHSHGTLFSLVNIAFAVTVWLAEAGPTRSWLLASRCLVVALILMPAGFLLAGTFVHGGDPGLGVVLVPVGGIVLLVGVLAVATGLSPRRR